MSHLAELFTRHGLRFTPQAGTEASNKPDFIFPGEREYHDATFNAALLVMLGVKSTSKDRWRQAGGARLLTSRHFVASSLWLDPIGAQRQHYIGSRGRSPHR